MGLFTGFYGMLVLMRLYVLNVVVVVDNAKHSANGKEIEMAVYFVLLAGEENNLLTLILAYN